MYVSACAHVLAAFAFGCMRALLRNPYFMGDVLQKEYKTRILGMFPQHWDNQFVLIAITREEQKSKANVYRITTYFPTKILTFLRLVILMCS